MNRQKRNANDGCCKKSAAAQQQPIVVNHYHNYYYNCPCVPLPQPTPQTPKPVTSPSSTCVDCSCDKSGSISCSVPQNSPSNYQQPSGKSYQQAGTTYQQSYPAAGENGVQPEQSQRKDLTEQDKNDAFSFSVLFDDPIAKDFYNFVTTNFVKRDNPIKIAEIKCETDPLSVLEDPICKEFFNLFTQTFVRKPENTTANPDQSKVSTLKPTCRQTNRRT